MFDEVLKYGSMIVDAFVAYKQPVFVFIPPFAEIRGGAWVVVDSTINASVMEMYAASKTARGGVLEANGTASVKYRTKDLISTMHRLDNVLKELDSKLSIAVDESDKKSIKISISERENALLPVYAQIAVKFCELHDTPGRMKATGVIEREVDWEHARTFFYWRLRRKLAEFDLRRKLVDAANVGKSGSLSVIEASSMIRDWFCEETTSSWNDDKAVLSWMAKSHEHLETKVVELKKQSIAREVEEAIATGGEIGLSGLIAGVGNAIEKMNDVEKSKFKEMIKMWNMGN